MTGLGENGQAEAKKVFIECETRNMIKERSDHNERDRIAEREAMVAGVRAKDLFGLITYVITVRNNLKSWFDFMKKRQCGLRVAPIAKQRHRFADDVPGGAPRRSGGRRFFHEGVGLPMVPVFRIKAGIEE
jgi:hypothetical protein